MFPRIAKIRNNVLKMLSGDYVPEHQRKINGIIYQAKSELKFLCTRYEESCLELGRVHARTHSYSLMGDAEYDRAHQMASARCHEFRILMLNQQRVVDMLETSLV